MTRLIEPYDDGTIQQRTFVCFILDASGSMEDSKAQVLSGYREYVGTLHREAGDLRFGLTTFNTECRRVVEPGTPIASVQPLTEETYQPSGMTALYDAIAETVAAMETWLPEGGDWRALCVILTDGLENSSRTQTKETLKALIEAREATGRWTFTYLGANQDAWAEASKMGMAVGNVAGYAVADMGATMRMAAASTVTYHTSVDRQSKGFYRQEGGVVKWED